jgi:glycolate oxidase FAD binding subunit
MAQSRVAAMNARGRAERVARAAEARWGPDAVRVGESGDAIGAVLTILEPPDASALAEMLRWADAERLTLAPRGAGTRLAWSAAAGPPDAVLSTSRLNAPIDHCAGDLTATVPAGAALAAVNTVLGRERQWLPLDPPMRERATVGGIVATNDSGPRRHRHGAPRDLLIGVELALANGTRGKAGGRVVKNVAGYDLGRLLCGSFGSLAVVTAATFKLAPLPAASRTVVASADTAESLARITELVAASPLTPSAIELEAPRHRLLVRFETTERAADRQAGSASTICLQQGAGVVTLGGEDEAAVWRAYESAVWGGGGVLLKVAVLPTRVGALLERLATLSEQNALEYRAGGRAALGLLYVRLPESRPGGAADRVAQAVAFITAVRAHAEADGGSAVIVAASPAVREQIDVWGSPGDAVALMRAVKARFDPNRTLSPGGGPAGL